MLIGSKMKQQLALNLIKNKHIRYGTEVKADYFNKDSFGLPSLCEKRFRVIRASQANDKLIFTLSDMDDAARIVKVESEYIKEIDGMTENRFLTAYRLDENGQRIILRRKRKQLS